MAALKGFGLFRFPPSGLNYYHCPENYAIRCSSLGRPHKIAVRPRSGGILASPTSACLLGGPPFAPCLGFSLESQRAGCCL